VKQSSRYGFTGPTPAFRVTYCGDRIEARFIGEPSLTGP
jgi:hypothetical protein